MDFSIAPSVDISIHAPRTGSDYIRRGKARRGCISIHAPRTGSDLRTQSWGTRNQYFNPRSPHGERLPRKQAAERTTAFQSTLPARGATFINKE